MTPQQEVLKQAFKKRNMTRVDIDGFPFYGIWFESTDFMFIFNLNDLLVGLVEQGNSKYTLSPQTFEAWLADRAYVLKDILEKQARVI